MIFPLALQLFVAGHSLAENKPIDTKLATMVEQVATKTGININISQTDTYAINIDKVNGKNVCSPEAEKDVRILQAAFIAHPSIYRSYSIYLISITQADGKPTQADYASLKSQGIFTGDCINLYVSIRPE